MTQYTKAYISELLDKYLDGTSTLEEEDILSQYFSQEPIPAEWEQYRLLFAEIEAMKPPRAKRRWLGWCAAAVVGSILMITSLSQLSPTTVPPTAPLTAKADTTAVLLPEAPNEQPIPDTMALQKLRPMQQQRKRQRKQEPTIHDYDKAYALMAQAEKEQQQVQQEMELVRQEVLHAQLVAAGYVVIRQDDGTIIYTNEPKEYFAYEE